MSHLLPVLSGNVAIGPASATSTVQAPANVFLVRLAATAGAYVKIGPNPVADTTGSMMIQGGSPGETFQCQSGDQIAAIQVSGAGSLNITFLSK
jgi:hypothetical protein